MNNEMYDNENKDLLEPPHHDMLMVKFRGDADSLTLPYVEVLNGELKSVDAGYVHVQFDNKVTNALPRVEFVQSVEKAFDTKAVVELSVQLKGMYEPIKLL
jgi:hypothetical protein